MKRSIIIMFLILATSWAPSVFADGDNAAPKGEPKFKEGSAVTAFDPQEGFKLTDPSLSSLGVNFKKLAGGAGPWTVPKAALVRIKHTTGIYRRVEGWISFVLVEAQSKSSGETSIRSDDLQAGDEVAVEGASFLRMTEADLNSDTVDSCAH